MATNKEKVRGMETVEYSIGIVEGGACYVIMYKDKGWGGHSLLKDVDDGLDCVEKALLYIKEHARGFGVLPRITIGAAPDRMVELGLRDSDHSAYEEGKRLR